MQDATTAGRIRQKYRALSPLVDERMRRQWAATDASALGWGGVSLVSSATGLARIPQSVNNAAAVIRFHNETVDDNTVSIGTFYSAYSSGYPSAVGPDGLASIMDHLISNYITANSLLRPGGFYSAAQGWNWTTRGGFQPVGDYSDNDTVTYQYYAGVYAVPEPGSATLLFLGGVGLLARRRRVAR